MYKKTLTYTDFNGVERTEDFYFNLSKAELMDLNFSTEGGLLEIIKKIVAAKDTPELIKLFKKTIILSYGIKSDDGKRFKKSDEIREDFISSEAYSEIYMELATNSDAAAEFINGILPADLATKANEMISSGEIDDETKRLLDSLNSEASAQAK